jgi:hypothetical protein
MRSGCRLALGIAVAVLAAIPSAGLAAEEKTYALSVRGGFFYGPGKMPDSPLPEGLLGGIVFDRPFSGETHWFNNGPEPPNVHGGQEADGVTDGKMSNGIEFNEHVWGGLCEVGMGAMRFMVVVGAGGPNKGREIYELEPDYNWRITTDLILDPGFPEGIVMSEDIRISTGVTWVRPSLQTRDGVPGGIDQAGSLPSGVPVIGWLGDYDLDGLLDGLIGGASNIPVDHMFTPGAPVIQTREFVSDIPVQPVDAALFSVASIRNYEEVWKALGDKSSRSPLAISYMQAKVGDYLQDILRRWDGASRLLERVPAARAGGLAEARQAVAAQRAATAALVEKSGSLPAAEIEAQVRAITAVARRVTGLLEPLATFSPKSS